MWQSEDNVYGLMTLICLPVCLFALSLTYFMFMIFKHG